MVYRHPIMYFKFMQFIVVNDINADKDMTLTVPDRSGSSGAANADFAGSTERADGSGSGPGAQRAGKGKAGARVLNRRGHQEERSAARALGGRRAFQPAGRSHHLFFKIHKMSPHT